MKDLKACDDTAGRTTKPTRLKYYYIPRGFNVAHNSSFFPNVEATQKKLSDSINRKEYLKDEKLEKGCTEFTRALPQLMSHLLGRAILDQGRDYQPVLGLVFSQTEAETCAILEEGMKKSSKSTKQKQKQQKTPLQNISKNLWQDDVLDVVWL